ncbi:hypothetical protein B0H66DRAFT_107467 [Apodospora peruviana]|uniref:Uncharacterized protein n=1 Tax=Apodospora peruviana TaxID=516989 RepID=A0AAE0IGW7_9PEZI|nr:hypothetical protein B0H66DRAFT_107467 [Apodospora peruviana]
MRVSWSAVLAACRRHSASLAGPRTNLPDPTPFLPFHRQVDPALFCRPSSGPSNAGQVRSGQTRQVDLLAELGTPLGADSHPASRLGRSLATGAPEILHNCCPDLHQWWMDGNGMEPPQCIRHQTVLGMNQHHPDSFINCCRSPEIDRAS